MDTESNAKDDFVGLLETVVSDDGNQDDVQNIYNRWAECYDKDLTTHCDYLPPKIVAEEAARRLGNRTSARIIDLGAGTGMGGQLLEGLGFSNVDALDANQEMLKVAKSKGCYKNLIHGFLGPERLNIDDASYDCLVCAGTFVPHHANESCFEELIRITKPGGFMVFVVKHAYFQGTCLRNFEPRMQQLEQENKWKLLNPDDFVTLLVLGDDKIVGKRYVLQKTP